MRKIKKAKVTRRPAKVLRRQPSRSLPLRSFLPLLIVVGILGLGYLGFRLFFRPQSVGINQVTGGTGTVSLALTPSSITKDANTTTDITLAINAGTSLATGVQVEIAFNPNKCVTPTVTQGDFFTETLMAATVASGKIKFAYGIHPSAEGKSGTGTVATITTGPKNDDCTLTFVNDLTKNLATVEGVATNALASATDAVIHLAGNSPAPSPSVTPTPTPSLTPTPTPTSSPRPCPSGWTAAMCAKLPSPTPKPNTTSLNNLIACLKDKGFNSAGKNYCTSSAFKTCTLTHPVAQCLDL